MDKNRTLTKAEKIKRKKKLLKMKKLQEKKE
jgi:hypothetical protein